MRGRTSSTSTRGGVVGLTRAAYGAAYANPPTEGEGALVVPVEDRRPRAARSRRRAEKVDCAARPGSGAGGTFSTKPAATSGDPDGVEQPGGVLCRAEVQADLGEVGAVDERGRREQHLGAVRHRDECGGEAGDELAHRGVASPSASREERLGGGGLRCGQRDGAPGGGGLAGTAGRSRPPWRRRRPARRRRRRGRTGRAPRGAQDGAPRQGSRTALRTETPTCPSSGGCVHRSADGCPRSAAARGGLTPCRPRRSG